MNSINAVPNGLTKRQNGDIMDAHRQWASRPADEAVRTVDELIARTKVTRETSAQKDGIPWDSLTVEAHGESLALVGRGGVPASFNNWSLGQLCSLPAKDGSTVAPLTFLDRLSTPVAAQVLQDRLSHGIGRVKPANLLVQRGEGLTLRSITTEAYERFWNHELALRVGHLCSRGTWQPAEAFRTATGRASHAWGEAQALPLGWVGDRSMFVALVDYDGAVTWNGNRYARFLMLSNSEVGAASLKVVFGLVDFVCGNFIFWGCQEVYEATIRHSKAITAKAADLFGSLSWRLESGDRDDIARGIDTASRYRLGDTEAEVIAVTRAVTELPAALVQEGFSRALKTERYGDPSSAWAMLNGLTEASQHAKDAAYADKRAAIDAKAARLMAYALKKA